MPIPRVPTSLDTSRVEMIRAAMPVLARAVYLNTGTNGPLLRHAVDGIVEYAREELQEGRIGQPRYDRWQATMSRARTLVAELLACTVEEVVITHNTTEGMNIALLGLDWHAGDELITANSEHEGGLNPAALLKARYGVKVVYTDIGLCNCDALASLERALTPRTKAVVLSHVSWSTGAVLPLREISERAHRVGALVICDAAQGAGMVPSRMSELDVDAYALSGQKWLCGPDGIGALYIRRELLSRIQNTFTGYWGIKGRVVHADTAIQFGDTAERYQYAAHYMPALAGFNRSLEWLRDEVGWDWLYRRTHELGQYAFQALSQVKGLHLYMPPDQIAGLVHFSSDDIEPADLTARLFERNILIRHVPQPVLNRVATGFFNTEEDIQQLADAISEIVQ